MGMVHERLGEEGGINATLNPASNSICDTKRHALKNRKMKTRKQRWNGTLKASKHLLIGSASKIREKGDS